MLTIEYTVVYGARLINARRFNDAEKASYAEWFRDYGLAVDGETIELPHIGWEDMPDRPADGEFPGSANRAWIITNEDAAAYKRIEAERAKEQQLANIQKNVEHCKRIVEYCERGYMVDTEEQAIQRAAAYNKIHNEGGEGYTPTWYTRQKYEKALAYIAEHDR